jgi:hypothetical protein
LKSFLLRLCRSGKSVVLVAPSVWLPTYHPLEASFDSLKATHREGEAPAKPKYFPHDRLEKGIWARQEPCPPISDFISAAAIINITPMSDASQPPPLPPGVFARPAWSPAHRVFFRWVFCYFLLYTLPSRGRVCLLPMQGLYLRAWEPLVEWVAVHVFHVGGHAATHFPTGSGDTTLNYVENYCYLVLAFAGTIVWSLLDRKRRDYATLHTYFRKWIRYTLALTLLSYGFAKVFPLQMQMNVGTMVERWGDFSPMSALWNFMGASAAYTSLSGGAEVLAGLLLLFRRTTLLGAMISFGVMFNVAALNYCYDVPVKLYSTNLVLMSVFLIGPDALRLTQLLILNRPTLAADLSRPVLPRLWTRIVWRLIWCILVCAMLLVTAFPSWRQYKRIYLNPQHPALYGLYEVESFAREGKDAPPLLADAARWHWLYFNSYGGMSLVTMNDESTHYGADQAPATNTVTFSSGKAKSVFTYSWSDTNHLVLRGSMAGNALDVRLRPVAATNFLLLNRGFHWINEYPFQR